MRGLSPTIKRIKVNLAVFTASDEIVHVNTAIDLFTELFNNNSANNWLEQKLHLKNWKLQCISGMLKPPKNKKSLN